MQIFFENYEDYTAFAEKIVIIQIKNAAVSDEFEVTKNAQPIEPTRLWSVIASSLCLQASLQHP